MEKICASGQKIDASQKIDCRCWFKKSASISIVKIRAYQKVGAKYVSEKKLALVPRQIRVSQKVGAVSASIPIEIFL